MEFKFCLEIFQKYQNFFETKQPQYTTDPFREELMIIFFYFRTHSPKALKTKQKTPLKQENNYFG